KIAVAVVGLLAVGHMAGAVATTFFAHPASYSGRTFVIGGIIGAVLLLMVFHWPLIVLSSVVGAHLILSALVLPQSGSTILFVALAAIGVIVQAASMRRSV